MLGATTSGLGFQITKSSFGASIAPHIGYFLGEKLAVGARLGFSFSSATGINGQASSVGFTTTPFIRYYIPFKEKLSFPINLELGYGATWHKADSLRYVSTGITGALKGGIAFFPNEHVSLDFLIGYSYSRYNTDMVFNPRGDGALVGNWGATLYFGK